MKRFCNHDDIIFRGKDYLYNNLWGRESGCGTQCIWEAPAPGAGLAWGTEWDWTGSSDTIKSYAAAVRGWHWGWKVARSDLPVRLSSLRSMHTAWEFNISHTRAGGTNVTYDLWFSENPHAENENPTAEVMIWLHRTGDIRPIGAWQTSTMIAGAGWEVWSGPHPASGWPVYSFVRTENTLAGSFDLANFIHDLISQGLNSSLYLLSIEAGVEVFTGAGRLDTTHYCIDIERS